MARRGLADRAHEWWVILAEAGASFARNGDSSRASSMAFSAMLAMIPALFLLTVLFGAAMGSSQRALARTQELVTQLIPRYGEVILREVRLLAAHRKALHLANLLLLVWGITPLVSSIRSAFETIFRARGTRNFLGRKAVDLGIVILLLLTVTAVAVIGVGVRYLRARTGAAPLSLAIRELLPFTIATASVLLLQASFTRGISRRHLLAGALATAVLWFAARPLFTVFLTFNHGYGVAFGSFKSVFTVVIWIYWSCAVFLLGAEVTAVLHRKEPIVLRRLMRNLRTVPRSLQERFLRRIPAGVRLFEDGDEGREMYYVAEGRVRIIKEGREIAAISPGTFVGEMSFLLRAPRTATAVTAEDSVFVVIDDRNMEALTRESPELVRGMLTEMAQRLRGTNNLLQ